jgi:predicted ATPase
MEIISVRRGFFSSIFSTEFDNDESSFAMQIREDLDFELKIDRYFNSIFNKNFRFVAIPGSTSFYLRTHTKNNRAVDLVNEGFGVNQTIYMLIKLLKKNTGLALIEEPEIHLHPTAQGKLVDAFVDIIAKEKKQILLTTHSENIVLSVLSKIAANELNKDDVQFFLVENINNETNVVPQQVNSNGQIEGGLMNFMETELTNLKKFLDA